MNSHREHQTADENYVANVTGLNSLHVRKLCRDESFCGWGNGYFAKHYNICLECSPLPELSEVFFEQLMDCPPHAEPEEIDLFDLAIW